MESVNAMSESKYFVLGTLVNILTYLSINDVYLDQSTFASVTKNDTLGEHMEAPFTRAVFIVVDGLRGDIFFRYPEWHPFLTNVTKYPGSSWGMIDVTGPTLSLPSIYTMFAGVEVDMRTGETDTVFTHVPSCLAVGCYSTILQSAYEDDMKKTFITSYHDNSTLKLFTELIRNSSIPRNEKAVLFIHFVNIDVLGHICSASSREMQAGIKTIDIMVANISSVVNEYFDDNRTLFVLTADHGMSESMQHGYSSLEETRVPFIVWGLEQGNTQPQIRHVDWAPSLAAALGLSIPSNSVGRVVHQIFSEKEFVYEVLRRNYLQLRALATAKWSELKEKLAFVVRFGGDPFPLLDDARRAALHKDNSSAASRMDAVITLTLEEIRYYDNYDRRCLQVIVTCIGMLWLVLLGMFVTTEVDSVVVSWTDLILTSAAALLLVKWYGWPMSRSVYLLVLIVMGLSLRRGWHQTSVDKRRLVVSTLKTVIPLGGLVGLAVQWRNTLPGLWSTVVILTSMPFVLFRTPLQRDVYLFTSCSVILGLLTYLSPVGLRRYPQIGPNYLYRLIGVIATFAVTFVKPSSNNEMAVLSNFEKAVTIFYKGFILIVGICVYFRDSLVTKVLAWGSMLLAYTVPVLVSQEEAFFLFLATSTPYLFMSISYEAIFYAVLFAYLCAWSRIKIRQEDILFDSIGHNWVHLIAVTLLLYGLNRPQHFAEFEEILTQVVGKVKPLDTPYVLISKYPGPLALILILRLEFLSRNNATYGKLNRLLLMFQGQSTAIVSFLLTTTTHTHYVEQDYVVNHVLMMVIPWSLTCIDFIFDWFKSRKLSLTCIILLLLHTHLAIIVVIYVYVDYNNYLDSLRV